MGTDDNLEIPLYVQGLAAFSSNHVTVRGLGVPVLATLEGAQAGQLCRLEQANKVLAGLGVAQRASPPGRGVPGIKAPTRPGGASQRLASMAVHEQRQKGLNTRVLEQLDSLIQRDVDGIVADRTIELGVEASAHIREVRMPLRTRIS